MSNSKPLILDSETWGNQELYEVISSRYFILGIESTKIASWEVKGANGLDSSNSLILLNKHLESMGLIGTLSQDSIPILSIIALPPSTDILKKWQQISIWALMSLFLTIVGSEWLGRYDSNKEIMNLSTIQESLIFFTIPVIFSLLFASYLRAIIANRSNLETGFIIPIIFPILYPTWPFGMAGLLSQKRIDHLPFPSRKKLAIIESIIPVTLIIFGSILTIIGLFLTSDEPPGMTKSPIIFTVNTLTQSFAHILLGDIIELRLQWLHPTGISGIGLSMIGWILLLPIPGFPGDRVLYSLLGPSKIESGNHQTLLFIGSLIMMIVIFSSMDYLPWLFLSAFAAWQRFSPENVIDPLVIDKSKEIGQNFKLRFSAFLIFLIILGFPGLTPMSTFDNYDSGLSTENWKDEIYYENDENIELFIELKPQGILPVSGFLQFNIEGSQSELWDINSNCIIVNICYFNNVTHNDKGQLKIILNPPDLIVEEKLYLRIVIDVFNNEKEHLILLSNPNHSGPNEVFWKIIDDSEAPIICTKINVLPGETGNLSITSPYWNILNSTSLEDGINDLCLQGHEGALFSSNYTDRQFRQYGPSVYFDRDNNSTMTWSMPIENTIPKIMISGTEWQIPRWFNSVNTTYSIIYGSSNPSFCKSTSSVNEVSSNWTWLMEAYSPIKFQQGEVVNGTVIIPSEGWLMLCDGQIPVSKYLITEGLDIIIDNFSIGESIKTQNFTIYNRESKSMAISIEWHGDSTNTDIWDVQIPSYVNSNESVNVVINTKSSDILYRTSWVDIDDNGIIIHLAARCSIDGCSN